MTRQKLYSGVIVGAMLFAVAAGAGEATAQVTPLQQRVLGTSDEAAEAKLVQALLTVIAITGGQNFTQDIEGRLIYTIDQAQVSCSVSRAALQQLDRPEDKLTPIQRLAVEAVERSLSRCRSNGTAALYGQNYADIGQGTSFGLSGGSSNYLNVQN